ncbi:MAG: LCP family protein, partial [Candidatus Portnoybacteria bacterium]|nr:LCP family protein [Candidatus Portnoybacteria bacterium]
MENEYYYISKPEKKRRKWPWIFGVLILLAAIGSLFYKTGFIFSQMQSGNEGAVLPISEDWPQPEKDPDRTNILLLGLRGAGDENGGLLTDTIILLSVKKSTNEVAMISIPRDLYVVMPQAPGQKNSLKEKINFAYALGEERKSGGGLVYSKAVVSRITNLYIDYAVSVDFMAFKETVDILGGIDVNLENPFVETTQFAKEMVLELPAGKNHLDGETALFFVRSRYSTSDFDRARRQQQVLLAIKNKALSSGILLNPVKIFELLNTMGRH